MGLSATYNRPIRRGGSRRLLQFFGEVLDPRVGIADAILMRRLVPYDYRLHTCQLDDDEAQTTELDVADCEVRCPGEWERRKMTGFATSSSSGLDLKQVARRCLPPSRSWHQNLSGERDGGLL